MVHTHLLTFGSLPFQKPMRQTSRSASYMAELYAPPSTRMRSSTGPCLIIEALKSRPEMQQGLSSDGLLMVNESGSYAATRRLSWMSSSLPTIACWSPQLLTEPHACGTLARDAKLE